MNIERFLFNYDALDACPAPIDSIHHSIIPLFHYSIIP